jgi:hypothetical protein
VGPEVGFLDGVLGFLVVAQEPAGEIVGGIEVRKENLLEGGGAITALFARGFHHMPDRIGSRFIPGGRRKINFLFRE